MGKRTILFDDLDGRELPGDTQGQKVRFDGKDYEVFLSADSTDKFLAFLKGDAPLARTAPSPRPSRAAASHDKERMKAIRAWAIENKVKYKNAQGNEVTLGERGRIPQEIIDAYDKA